MESLEMVQQLLKGILDGQGVWLQQSFPTNPSKETNMGTSTVSRKSYYHKGDQVGLSKIP